MILIVGHRPDPHVTSVAQALEKQGHRFVVMDAYSNNSDGLFHTVTSGAILKVGGQATRLSDVNAVWWRQKPKFTVPNDTVVALYDYYFVHREWNFLIDYLGFETDRVFSINNRSKAAAANNKIMQLKFATEVDFAVPTTLISNDYDSSC